MDSLSVLQRLGTSRFIDELGMTLAAVADEVTLTRKKGKVTTSIHTQRWQTVISTSASRAFCSALLRIESRTWNVCAPTTAVVLTITREMPRGMLAIRSDIA